MMSEYHNINSEVNTPKHHHEINLMSSRMCQFPPVSDVNTVTIIGAGEGINTQFLTEGATDMSSHVRSSIHSIDEMVRQDRSSDMSLSSQ